MTALGPSTDLRIEGMTCASCVRRVERSLAGDDGAVSAHVNLATGVAHVEHHGAVDVAELVSRVERAGYGAHEIREHDDTQAMHHHAARGLGPRFVASAVLTLPLVLAMVVPALREWITDAVGFALATPVALWAAWPFHVVAARGARHRAATMDTLVSVGILAAWGWSLAALVRGDGHSYVEVAAVTTTLVLGGRLLEARARNHAGDALRRLLDGAARTASRLDADGTERRVPAASLQVGDRFVVRPGDLVATDGVVESGDSSVDRSLVTGESRPEPAAAGDEVLGGTQNVDGRLVVRATRVGADTALAQVARLVAEAQAGRARVQRLADAVAAVFVPVVIGLALLTLVGWLAFGGSGAAAVSAAVAVLIVACPCALGLATPTALLVGSGRGAQLGIVIRGPEVLERAREIDTVVLDKTGTITSGAFSVVEVTALGDAAREDVLRIAAALETASEHPVARAIAAAVDGPHPQVTGFANRPGRGVVGTVDGRDALVGRATLLDELGVAYDRADLPAAPDGATRVLVAWDGELRGVVDLRDEPRGDSAGAVAELRRLGLEVVLATGDSPDAARAAAERVGITDVRAGLLPADKVAIVNRLQSEGRRVAMVGDGVNDAPALAQADLGIAIGTGADVAVEASDLTLVSPSLWSAVDAVRLSRATLGRIRRNLFWAFAYNVAALPLAMAGLLEPMIAGGAMAASSLFVVGGSLSLRRFKPADRG